MIFLQVNLQDRFGQVMIHNLRVCFVYCRVIHKPFWSTELIIVVMDGIASFMYEICKKSSECLFQCSSGRLKKCREKSNDKFYAHQKSDACCFYMDESIDNDNFAQASKLFMLNCREETVNFLVHWLVLILNHM